MFVSCTGLDQSIDPVNESIRPSNSADAIAIPVAFGVIGVVLTLATTIVGIIQIRTARKHQQETAKCQADLESAVEPPSPSPDVSMATSSDVAVQKMASCL